MTEQSYPPPTVSLTTIAEIRARHRPFRHRLPDERAAVTHGFVIAGHEGSISTGEYPPEDGGGLGEIFIRMSKQGSTVSGFTEAVSTLTSLCLQYNVPLAVLCEKFTGMRFEPAGITSNPEIREVTSVLDYVFRYLWMRFGSADDCNGENGSA